MSNHQNNRSGTDNNVDPEPSCNDRMLIVVLHERKSLTGETVLISSNLPFSAPRINFTEGGFCPIANNTSRGAYTNLNNGFSVGV